MKICSVEGCEKAVYAKGFCLKHYRQLRAYGKIQPDCLGHKKGSPIDNRGDHAAVLIYGIDKILKAECLIDLEDVEVVRFHKWNINYHGYVYSRSCKHKFIHRAIIGESVLGKHVDHIDWNPLNNRRSNLRLATSMENQWNTRLTKRNRSGFKGVSRSYGKWRADTRVDGLPVYIGRYDNPEDAAMAYDNHVLSHRGEFAVTNASLGLL